MPLARSYRKERNGSSLIAILWSILWGPLERLGGARGETVLRHPAAIALFLSFALGTTAAPRSPVRRMLVVCSPGSPGTTAEAQPTLDSFAQAAGRAAGWPAGNLGAIYFESLEEGLPRFSQPDAALAMVPLPFLMRYGQELGLKPRLETVPESGAREVWSLVAKKGRVPSPAALDGWEVTGAPGYAEDFVRNILLGDWGGLPSDTKITFTARVLTVLRRAASGEKVVVLLDRTQVASLSSLPFAADLQVVYRSRPFPSGFLCLVRDRLPAADAKSLLQALLRFHENAAGREVLKSLRMVRFARVDEAELDKIRRPLPSVEGSAK